MKKRKKKGRKNKMSAGFPVWEGGVYRTPVYEAKKDAAVEAALNEVAGLMCSRHLSLEDAATSDKSLRYVMGYNGVSVIRKEVLNGNPVTVTLKATKVPGAPVLDESLEIDLQEKLPKSILRTLMAAFKAVYDRDKTECAAQVYRTRDTKDYFIYYPEQKNAGASSTYADDKLATEQLRTTMDFIMEAHSHCGFGAFFSGTDNANENTLLFYIVLGNFNSEQCSFVARAKVENVTKTYEIGDIFEGATTEDLKLTDLPTEFGDILTKAKKGYTGYSYSYGGYEYGYGQTVDRDALGRFQRLPALPAAPASTTQVAGASTHRQNRWKMRNAASDRTTKLDVNWFLAVMTDDEILDLKKALEERQA